MKTLFAVLESYQEAKQAVDRLIEAGYSEEQMNIIVEPDAARQMMAELDFERIKAEKSGALTENPIRGLDRLLTGRVPTNIPDAGKVIAAGDLALVMVKTASAPRALNDGLQAVMEEFGIPSPAAKEYLDEINAGNILFFMRTAAERAGHASDLIRAGNDFQVESFPA
jgi:hypothetical protein